MTSAQSPADSSNGVRPFGPNPPIGLHSAVLCGVALFLAIGTVDHAPSAPWQSDKNCSPLGYTFSLALFLIPSVSLAAWFFRHRQQLQVQWRAFWMAVPTITVTWVLVDILLGNAFFSFPNRNATLGVLVPGYWQGRGWPRTIPVEEFAFYSLGSSWIVLGYVAACNSWMKAYTPGHEAYVERLRGMRQVFRLHARSLLVGGLLFLAALAWKKLGPHENHTGFPGYFLFELALVVAPSALLYGLVGSLINRAAFAYVMTSLVGVSLLWEVTLALPYGWWGYKPDQMMGLFVRPWYNLPIEAVMLWPAAGWTNILAFEAAALYVISRRYQGVKPAD